jgi:hypothetical protein
MTQNIVGFFKREIPYTFSLENHVVGWMIWWRTFLGTMVCGALVALLLLGIGKLFGIANVANFVNLGTQIVIWIAMIFILNITGKMVVKKRYHKTIDHFIGWSIFWRFFLWNLMLSVVRFLIPAILTAIFPIFILLVISADAFIYIGVVSYGWSARRVFAKVADIS